MLFLPSDLLESRCFWRDAGPEATYLRLQTPTHRDVRHFGFAKENHPIGTANFPSSFCPRDFRKNELGCWLWDGSSASLRDRGMGLRWVQGLGEHLAVRSEKGGELLGQAGNSFCDLQIHACHLPRDSLPQPCTPTSQVATSALPGGSAHTWG